MKLFFQHLLTQVKENLLMADSRIINEMLTPDVDEEISPIRKQSAVYLWLILSNEFYLTNVALNLTLLKNTYPQFLINKVIRKYLNYKFSSNQNQLKDTSEVHYFKLLYGQPIRSN